MLKRSRKSKCNPDRVAGMVQLRVGSDNGLKGIVSERLVSLQKSGTPGSSASSSLLFKDKPIVQLILPGTGQT